MTHEKNLELDYTKGGVQRHAAKHPNVCFVITMSIIWANELFVFTICTMVCTTGSPRVSERK